MDYSPINLILNYLILWTMTHAAQSVDNVSLLLAQNTSLKDAIWKLSWCRKVTRCQNWQYLCMFYLRPHTSDIRVFCLHFRRFILRHSQLRYKTFVTLGISTSVIISDLEPIASAIMFFQRSFFHSENFQMLTVKFPLKWIAYLCLLFTWERDTVNPKLLHC